MITVPVPQTFVVGLTASLRQACLSLHRAYSIYELTEYYTSGTRSVLFGALVALCRIQEDGVPSGTEMGPTSRFRAILEIWIAWWLLGMGRLPRSLVSRVVRVGNEFASLVQKGGCELDSRSRSELRMELESCCEELSRCIPSRRTRQRVWNVTHLGQATHLATRDVDEFAGARWFDL